MAAALLGHSDASPIRAKANSVLRATALPTLGIGVFLALWQLMAINIETSLGAFPGPSEVLDQIENLAEEHVRTREKAEAFYERQDKRNAKLLERDPNASIKVRSYTGKPTFLNQVITSLYTVAFGFVIASLIAVPLGIVCGIHESIYKAVNPIIQVFKPISPLAWLPLVTMVISAVYVADDQFPDVLTVKFATVLPSFVIRGFLPEAFLVVARAALGFCAGLLALFVLLHVLIHDVGAPLVIPRIRCLDDVLEPGLAWPVEALGLTIHSVLEVVCYIAGPWQVGSVLVLTAAGVATEKTRL